MECRELGIVAVACQQVMMGIPHIGRLEKIGRLLVQPASSSRWQMFSAVTFFSLRERRSLVSLISIPNVLSPCTALTGAEFLSTTVAICLSVVFIAQYVIALLIDLGEHILSRR